MTRMPMLPASVMLPDKNWTFVPVSAAVAIIVVDGSTVLMQHRDTREGLLFPGQWSLFGGGLDADEEPIDALIRELHEEIRLTITTADAEYFTAVDYDFEFCGKGWLWRRYYVVNITATQLAGLKQHEGDAMKTFTLPDILAEEKVVPFDAWALWMYANKTALSE